jgi:hypothetical protein
VHAVIVLDGTANQMMDQFRGLFGDPLIAGILTVLGLVIGVVGAAVGVAGFRAARRSVRPMWRMRTLNLVDSKVGSLIDLRITHRHIPITCLSLTRVVF